MSNEINKRQALNACHSVCVCYLTKKDGGTAYTVDYAEKQRLEIINLTL